MKKSAMILLTGLILLSLPVLASASGNHQRGHRYAHSDRGDRNTSYAVHVHHGDRHPQIYQRHLRHEKRWLKRELRETRRELRHAKRKIRHQRSRPFYAVQPYYVNPPIVFGYPSLVLQFGW